MGISVHHVAVIFTLLFPWFLATKARIGPDISKIIFEKELPLYLQEKNGFGTLQDFVSNLPFDRQLSRTREMIRPRSIRVGEPNLFSARGYGKRANDNKGAIPKKKEMSLYIARNYGKRNDEKMKPFLCIITKCKNYSGNLNVDQAGNEIQRQNKEFSQENALDED